MWNWINFARKYMLLKHHKIHLKSFECKICKLPFDRQRRLNNHITNKRANIKSQLNHMQRTTCASSGIGARNNRANSKKRNNYVILNLQILAIKKQLNKKTKLNYYSKMKIKYHNFIVNLLIKIFVKLSKE